MEFDLLVIFLPFLGLFAGLFVSLLAKEELVPGRKYFEWLYKAVFILLVFCIFYAFEWVELGVLFVILFSIMLFRTGRDYSTKIFFSLPFFIVIGLFKDLVTVPVLGFLYTFPVAALFAGFNPSKNFFELSKELFMRTYWYLIISLLVFVLFMFL